MDFSVTIAISDLKGSRSRHLIRRYVSIEGQGHFLTSAQGRVHAKIQTGFSQKLLYRSKPNLRGQCSVDNLRSPQQEPRKVRKSWPIKSCPTVTMYSDPRSVPRLAVCDNWVRSLIIARSRVARGCARFSVDHCFWCTLENYLGFNVAIVRWQSRMGEEVVSGERTRKHARLCVITLSGVTFYCIEDNCGVGPKTRRIPRVCRRERYMIFCATCE